MDPLGALQAEDAGREPQRDAVIWAQRRSSFKPCNKCIEKAGLPI